MSPAPPSRIHIDTDPGLDDLLALALALACPELEIVGVTTVAGNAGIEAVTDNAQRFLALAGCEAPLGRGAARPLTRDQHDATSYHGQDGRAGIPIPALDRRPLPSAETVLLSSLREQKVDQVLALGPLTNLAALLEQEPECLAQTELIWMGGTLSEGNVTGLAEFNAYADPAAAERVLEAQTQLRIVGLDVTRDTHIVPSMLPRGRFGDTEMGRLIWNVLQAQLRAEEPVHGTPRATLHDPCALLACLPLDLVRWEPKSLEIHLEDDHERGRMREQNQDLRRASYASEVDTERATELFLTRLKHYASGQSI